MLHVHRDSKVLLNEKKLTTVVVKGEHVSTKSYVKRNPYVKTSFMQVVDPRKKWEGSRSKFASLVQEKVVTNDTQEYIDEALNMFIQDQLQSTFNSGISGPMSSSRRNSTRGYSLGSKPLSLVDKSHADKGSKKNLSLDRTLLKKMKISRRSIPVQSESRIEKIDEEASDALETADLEALNEDLRRQVETQIIVFE